MIILPLDQKYLIPLVPSTIQLTFIFRLLTRCLYHLVNTKSPSTQPSNIDSLNVELLLFYFVWSCIKGDSRVLHESYYVSPVSVKIFPLIPTFHNDTCRYNSSTLFPIGRREKATQSKPNPQKETKGKMDLVRNELKRV